MPRPKDVTVADMGKLLVLSDYLQPGENYLGYKGNKAIKPMDAVRIGKALGVTESQARRFYWEDKGCRHDSDGRTVWRSTLPQPDLLP